MIIKGLQQKSYFTGNCFEYGDTRRTARGDSGLHDMMMNHFLSLVDGVVDYYGADAGENEFKVDGMVFKVLEDPDDGYRSHLGTIEYSNESEGIFFHRPIAKVRIESFQNEPSSDPDDYLGTGYCEGYRLVDTTDGHEWLIFGTANTNDYYPYFVFKHSPKLEEK